MEFVARGLSTPGPLVLFPGAWNPPTRAHLAMAGAALAHASEVVFVLARAMPHKPLDRPGFQQRLDWLLTLSAADPRYSVALSGGGLFAQIARECRDLTGAERLFILCGRDAAERIVSWTYPEDDPIERQLEDFELLVAPRGGAYQPPAHLVKRIHALALPGSWEHVSSTDVRRRRAEGLPWEHLVPELIVDSVRRALD